MERNNIKKGFVEDELERVRKRGIEKEKMMEEEGLKKKVREKVKNVKYGRIWWIIEKNIDDEFLGIEERKMRKGSLDMIWNEVINEGKMEREMRSEMKFINVVMEDKRGEMRIRDGMENIVMKDEEGNRKEFEYRD